MGIAQVISINSSVSVEAKMPNSVVKSAGRALQILEFFDEVQREACVSEISRALRYPQSSTSVLLRSLVSMGYLQHDRYNRSYYPTRRVSLLGNWVDPSLVQNGALLEIAEELSVQTSRTVVMATANGLSAQYIYIHRASEQSDEANTLSIGALRPVARTAVGRALLSAHDDIYISKLLRRINAERRAEETVVDIPEFLAGLKIGRRCGYFKGSGANRGEVALAATLERARQMLVIAVEGDAESFAEREDHLAAMLRNATAKYSSLKRRISA